MVKERLTKNKLRNISKDVLVHKIFPELRIKNLYKLLIKYLSSIKPIDYHLFPCDAYVIEYKDNYDFQNKLDGYKIYTRTGKVRYHIYLKKSATIYKITCSDGRYRKYYISGKRIDEIVKRIKEISCEYNLY